MSLKFKDIFDEFGIDEAHQDEFRRVVVNAVPVEKSSQEFRSYILGNPQAKEALVISLKIHMGLLMKHLARCRNNPDEMQP